MHKLYDQLSSAIGIPILHIADATAEVLVRQNVIKVGLLGTRFTMEEDFYKERLKINYGIEVIVPDDNNRTIVHEVIYHELCLGVTEPSSKQHYLRIIDALAEQGADAVILGCTEIGLLVSQVDTSVQLLDTSGIHAQMAVQYMTGSD